MAIRSTPYAYPYTSPNSLFDGKFHQLPSNPCIPGYYFVLATESSNNLPLIKRVFPVFRPPTINIIPKSALGRATLCLPHLLTVRWLCDDYLAALPTYARVETRDSRLETQTMLRIGIRRPPLLAGLEYEYQ
jgi:hypothetical protein